MDTIWQTILDLNPYEQKDLSPWAIKARALAKEARRTDSPSTEPQVVGHYLNNFRMTSARHLTSNIHDKKPDNVSPSAPMMPYPGSRARHADRKTTFVPDGWHPGMKDPDIHGPITYTVVHFTPTPGRYYRMPASAPLPHPGLHNVASKLCRSLRRDNKRFIDHLDPDDTLYGKLWDLDEQDGLTDCRRRKEAKYLVQQARQDDRRKRRAYQVFGGFLKVACEKAAAEVSAHGYQYQVPRVVKACVEEIYRRGMDTADLFNVEPNATRVDELTRAFDRFNKNTDVFPDLRHENIHDVVALLSSWTDQLPVPFMHRTFFDAFTEWCVEPSLTREKEFHGKIHTRKREGADGEYPESETDTEAEAQIEEDEVCRGMPSFNSRKKRMRRHQRAIERHNRKAFAMHHPEQVISNRPSHTQRRVQMYKELYSQEKPQIKHAQLMLLLISPHSFGTMIYLFTFFASLLDHPANGVSARMLADKFAWPLFAGPNKYAPKDLMEWMLIRWDRIVHAFKSPAAKEWEERRAENKRRAEASYKRRERNFSTVSGVADPPPHYQEERRTSVDSDCSTAPSYHSTWTTSHDGAGPSSQTDSRRSPTHPSRVSSRRSSNASAIDASVSSSSSQLKFVTTLPVTPRYEDFNPGAPICDPSPSPAYEAEIMDTLATTPLNHDEDFQHQAKDGIDVWEEHQLAAIHAIESMLHPTRITTSNHDAEFTNHSEDITSLIDDYTNESSSSESDDSSPSTAVDSDALPLTHKGYFARPVTPPFPEDTRYIEVAPHEDDPVMLKSQFEAALQEREIAQKRLEELSQRVVGIHLC
ncbi:hypothetical protein EIP91_003000 [Steccherinum ochraceum]|uniref:Rho-GAP domain-containing protein n=1 Tax=Steccherinum ochraceum TaxID=92696 RepID=A0A4R0RMV1_9APHY|nr:hypothetical protein EIP91_003000 [Steccherinum ochraceum]